MTPPTPKMLEVLVKMASGWELAYGKLSRQVWLQREPGGRRESVAAWFAAELMARGLIRWQPEGGVQGTNLLALAHLTEAGRKLAEAQEKP